MTTVSKSQPKGVVHVIQFSCHTISSMVPLLSASKVWIYSVPPPPNVTYSVLKKPKTR